MADVGDAAPEADDADLPEDTWTVAHLNREIAAVIDAASDRFPTYVLGEVSEVNAYGFGTFFTLNDPDPETEAESM